MVMYRIFLREAFRTGSQYLIHLFPDSVQIVGRIVPDTIKFAIVVSRQICNSPRGRLRRQRAQPCRVVWQARQCPDGSRGCNLKRYILSADIGKEEIEVKFIVPVLDLLMKVTSLSCEAKHS